MTVDEKKDFEDVVMGRKRPARNTSDYERWCSTPSIAPVYYESEPPYEPGWITTTAPVIPTPEELERLFRPPERLTSTEGLVEWIMKVKPSLTAAAPIHVDDYLIDVAVEQSKIEELFFKVWREAEKCTGYNASDWYELAALLKL